MLYVIKKYNLAEWEDEGEENEIGEENFIIFKDTMFDISKDIDDKKFKSYRGKDITLCCAKDDFSEKYVGKGIDDPRVNLTGEEIENLTKYYK